MTHESLHNQTIIAKKSIACAYFPLSNNSINSNEILNIC